MRAGTDTVLAFVAAVVGADRLRPAMDTVETSRYFGLRGLLSIELEPVASRLQMVAEPFVIKARFAV